MNLDDDMSEEELDELARVGTNEEKRAVAKHPNISLETMMFLGDEGFGEDLEQNPILLLHVEAGSEGIHFVLSDIAKKTKQRDRLEELSFSSWSIVRQAVAQNINTQSSALVRLADDENRDVKYYVAWNKNTPSKALIALAKNESIYVRRGVANNSSTPPTTLSLLAKDVDENVRRGVATNASTPPAILSLLAKDQHEYVRKDAKKALAKRRRDA